MAAVRVLHCVAGLAHGGYESLIMNLYRCIDRDAVRFDFVSSFPVCTKANCTTSPVDAVRFMIRLS